jgi:hypothetical protein
MEDHHHMQCPSSLLQTLKLLAFKCCSQEVTCVLATAKSQDTITVLKAVLKAGVFMFQTVVHKTVLLDLAVV